MVDQTQVLLALGGGFSSLALLLLGGIYRELRTLRDTMNAVQIKCAGYDPRIFDLESTINKLPCLQPKCEALPHGK